MGRGGGWGGVGWRENGRKCREGREEKRDGMVGKGSEGRGRGDDGKEIRSVTPEEKLQTD